MVADATSALSDLQRQYYIQEITAFGADDIEEAAMAASLVTIATNTGNIADVENNTNSLTAGLASLVASNASRSIVNITTATTTLVKTGAGTLEVVNINSLGTVSSTTKIYDGINATGTLLATINSLAISGSFAYHAAVTVGITVVTTGTVAPDVTVVYR